MKNLIEKYQKGITIGGSIVFLLSATYYRNQMVELRRENQKLKTELQNCYSNDVNESTDETNEEIESSEE
jgi:N-acetylmuramic acid 6-phosphate (MurNAc-6-P) etherase